MPRTERSYLPGAVFHLTARTQGKEPWFTPVVRSRTVEYVASAIRVSDASLLAYAIMTNHLHLVVRQGEWPLDWVMQPILRRIALLVQRTHGVEGHVFERRFKDTPCLNPEHARNAIVYVHLNPVRAGMVVDAVAYPWSSHARYLREQAGPTCMAGAVAADTALGLFSPHGRASLAERRRAYRSYVEWRAAGGSRAPDGSLEGPSDRTPLPPTLSGEECWSRNFSPLFRGGARRTTGKGPGSPDSRVDLQEIAKQVLVERAPKMSLEVVRSGGKFKAVVEVRRAMIRRMSAAGFRGRAIARYLGVSDQCVSSILTASRRRHPPSIDGRDIAMAEPAGSGIWNMVH